MRTGQHGAVTSAVADAGEHDAIAVGQCPIDEEQQIVHVGDGGALDADVSTLQQTQVVRVAIPDNARQPLLVVSVRTENAGNRQTMLDVR